MKKKVTIGDSSILIVDDDEGIRQTLDMILQSKGYKTRTVATAEEALVILKEEFYSAALVDIGLPDMGGLDLLPKIEQVQPDTGVIMITGHATIESAMSALNAGACAYITKPFEVDELLAKIRDIIEKQRLVFENRRLLEEVQRELSVRKQAEKALRDNNELLESIMSNIHVLIAYMDKEFKFIRVNQRYAMEGGKRPDDFIGKNHFDLYPNSENQAIFRKVLRTGEPYYVFEKPFVYPDQPERGVTYWDWSLVPVNNDMGGVEGLILTLVNITERVRARQELQEAEAKYQTLVEQLPTIVYATELPEMKPVYVSPQIESLLGISAGDILSERVKWAEVVHPDDVAEVRRRVLDAVMKKTSSRLEYRVVTPAKTQEWIRDEISFVCNEAGEPVLMHGVLSVITKEREAEEQLRKLQQEVVNISSMEKRRIGEELHDNLGQKLTGTAMLVKMIQKKLRERSVNDLSEDMGEILEYIRTAQMQVSDMARGLYPVEIDSGGLVRALDRLVRSFERYSTLAFNFHCDEEILVENNDVATAFYHIAQESINNAIKHAGAKKVYVSLKCEDNVLELTVKDDGKGMNVESNAPGMGLYIMRCRAATVGAQLEVGNSDLGGVGITSTIALQ